MECGAIPYCWRDEAQSSVQTSTRADPGTQLSNHSYKKIKLALRDLCVPDLMKKKRYDFELLFRALADRTRLRVINLIADGEVCVCFFVKVLGTNQPKVSRHLAYLRRAGLVSTRRDGKWIHYRLCEPKDLDAARIFREVRIWLTSNSEMQVDKVRLNDLRHEPSQHAPVQRASGSASIGA